MVNEQKYLEDRPPYRADQEPITRREIAVSDSRLFATIHSHLLPRHQLQVEVEVAYSIVSAWWTLVRYSKSNPPAARRRRLADFLLSIVAVVATASTGRPL